MKTYTIGLNVAGNIQFILDILATDFDTAARSWAFTTGHFDELYNTKKQTYFGWPIVVTTEKSLQRKENLNPFQY